MLSISRIVAASDVTTKLNNENQNRNQSQGTFDEVFQEAKNAKQTKDEKNIKPIDLTALESHYILYNRNAQEIAWQSKGNQYNMQK